MASSGIDYTLFFRTLATATSAQAFAAHAYDGGRFEQALPQLGGWLHRYAARGATDADAAGRVERMHAANPLYLPRNWLLQEAIEAATQDDLQPLNRLLGPALALGMQGLADRMVDDFVREADRVGSAA